MQIPVFIVEEYQETEGSEVMKVQRNLILLHWGLKEAYFPVLPENKIFVPMNVTVGICRDPHTGETLSINPELIYFHSDPNTITG